MTEKETQILERSIDSGIQVEPKQEVDLKVEEIVKNYNNISKLMKNKDEKERKEEEEDEAKKEKLQYLNNKDSE